MTHVDDRLAGVLKQAPTGFSLAHRGTAFAIGRFRVDSSSTVQATSFDIRITERHGVIEASEKLPGTLLPKNCPERHINPDHTFCLGLNVGVDLVTAADIDDWWLLLAQFLCIQIVATRTKRWPRHQMLSHGDAGEVHAAALAVASRLGINSEYEAHLIGCRNWITELVEDYKSRQAITAKKSLPVTHLSDNLVARAIGKIASVHLRGDTTPRKCRRLLRRLAALELKRVAKEREFWQSRSAMGLKCCGTMASCPLHGADDARYVDSSLPGNTNRLVR